MLFILFYSGSKCTGMETLDHIVRVFRARDGEQTLQAAGAEQALAEKDEGKKKRNQSKTDYFCLERFVFVCVFSGKKKKWKKKQHISGVRRGEIVKSSVFLFLARPKTAQPRSNASGHPQMCR